MKILLIGPQGCGKGTIAEKLSVEFSIPALSIGQLLRSVEPDSKYYSVVTSHLNSGKLVPEDIVVQFIEEELKKDKYANGYIFDGWARRMSDLDAFNPGFDVVIVFELSKESSIRRITGRRICSSDNKTYNIYTMPEQVKECKGELVQREDDTEEAVNKRLQIFNTETKEVIAYLDKLGITIHIDAEPMPDVIFANTLASLEKFFRKNS